ncbi:hypothetical protein [Arcticibacterium luteifluviistationis]|uniref:Uncharacterized protein n=1 Tax=Arcticibacterium luteifluviistationis TaxID=1784714 RepID=A0A2Z4GE38_9BACT|nr:hypothetical protein [Arcticibacterium luteifluviistationis]AWV99387.1 hypothetical protein DJ013_14955 [Arcticibacterium luteifluviistationis]
MPANKVKVITVFNFPYGFNDLVSLDLNSSKFEKIVIDLSRMDFIYPSSVIVLAAYTISMATKDITVEVYYPRPNEVKEYLVEIGFRQFCMNNLDTNFNISNYNSTNSLIPIVRLEKERLHEYIQFIKKEINNYSTGKDLSAIEICISEIINNIYDHSNGRAFCFAQYYKKKSEFVFSAYDFGIGIINQVKNFLKDPTPKEPIEYLKWAMTLGNTSHSTQHNAGKGLDNIVSQLNSNNSELTIYANNTRYTSKENTHKFSNNPINHFEGTLIEIKISIDNLPNLELEHIEFDF